RSHRGGFLRRKGQEEPEAVKRLSFFVDRRGRPSLPEHFYSFAAKERSVRSNCRARRWARVSPGASASCRKSEGLSISSAMPGSDSTTHGFCVARAAARCGLKLSFPKRRGNKPT